MYSSKITHNGPPGSLIAYWVGRMWLGLSGWKVVGQVPPGRRFVLIGAPHTSNWDFAFGLATLYVVRLKVSWMGKDSLFKKPFGGLMRWLGGIPINRSSPQGMVEQTVAQFANTRQLALLITPSATRAKKDYWKTGFYRIAHAAQIPIICGYLDYSKKEACLGLSLVPTGNIQDDMDKIREFYDGVQGKHPELTTRIKLRDEED
ncbi:lysophospholipid acyltransferase family protein [bacterium]|nr:lysophospholipid acyltransferase family protein [bacterium]